MSRRSRSSFDRITDPGDAGSSFSRFGTGCAVAVVVFVLLIGALGIGIGASRRLSGWGVDDEGEPIASGEGEPVEGEGGEVAEGTPTEPALDPRDDPRVQMRERYRPGPFVTVESMVPSGRLMPDVRVNTAPDARTIDTPWVVVGAELRSGRLPSSGGVGPSVARDASEDWSSPLTVLARTPERALVTARDANGGSAVTAYVVDFVGYDGHFFLPATLQTELGAVQADGSEGATIFFALQAPVLPGGRTFGTGQAYPVTMRIASVDAEGRVSPPIERPLSIRAVGTGDVEVTLTMGEPTDLDLYVTDPAGVVVYYGNRNSFSGGHLDLDANAACSSNMGVDNEHVYWPEHGAPAGTYRVHVAHYESCIAGRPVSYRVTVSACGETAVLTGELTGAQSRSCGRPGPGERAWCHDVVTFDIPPCVTM